MTNGLADGIVYSRLLDFADKYLPGQLRLNLHASVTYVVGLPCNLDSLGIDCTNNPNANPWAWKRMSALGIRIQMLHIAKRLLECPSDKAKTEFLQPLRLHTSSIVPHGGFNAPHNQFLM